VRETVESVAALLAEQVHRKGLELDAIVHRDIPRRLRGDPLRVRQVLLNLLGNALKFTEQGEIVVHARLVANTPEAAIVRFEVTDTGIGIAPEAQARLFQPFSQLDASTTRNYGGTGLGLTISKRLVELMGGEIGLDSAPGRGSTFWFTVRFAPAVAPSTPEPASPLEGLRVLVVDDSLAGRTMLQEQLVSLRMHAACADDGLRALALLREAAGAGAPYDVVLLDAQMPMMDGRDLARAIRADPTLAATRLILLSPTEQSEADAAAEADVAATLPKPVRQSQLFDTIAQVIGQPRAAAGRARAAPGSAVGPGASSSANGARILVVEDSPINRTVALGVLEELGYAAATAENGRQAIEALRQSPYAAVLMDCQMPEMDGYTAAREIRRREPPEAHLPIIGLTANAMQGDRERCLAAGMDDYLSKPFRPRELATVLERWVGPSPAAHCSESATAQAAPAAPPAALPDPIDRAHLGRLRPALVAELITLFRQAAPQRVAALRDACQRGDAAALSNAAHALKGEAAAIGAHELEDLCRALERLGAAHTVVGADALLESLDGALQRATAALR
jgi:two-component system sensor histidine kinase/response regulator